jgi:hypothetical protein
MAGTDAGQTLIAQGPEWRIIDDIPNGSKG